MSHKILYIPEGKYLKLGWNHDTILEKVLDGTQLRNCKHNIYAKTPEQAIKSILTWAKTDTFFRTNNIPYPIIESELEIIEIPD